MDRFSEDFSRPQPGNTARVQVKVNSCPVSTLVLNSAILCSITLFNLFYHILLASHKMTESRLGLNTNPFLPCMHVNAHIFASSMYPAFTELIIACCSQRHVHYVAVCLPKNISVPMREVVVT